MVAAKSENVNAAGLKSVWTDTIDRIKGAEKNWQDRVDQLNGRVQQVEQELRDFVKKVENDGKKRFESIREQLKVDEFINRFVSTKETEDSVEVEVTEAPTFATADAMTTIETKVAKLSTKLDSLRRKASNHVTKNAHQKLTARVTALEKALAALESNAA